MKIDLAPLKIEPTAKETELWQKALAAGVIAARITRPVLILRNKA